MTSVEPSPMPVRRSSPGVGALLAAGLLAAAAGCDRGSVPGVRTAAADSDSSEVTPRAEVPEAARALTDSFANAAAAIRPSVVRIDVEVSVDPRRLTRGPSGGDGLPPGLDDLFRRFFDFGVPGPSLPAPGPQRGTGSGVVLDEQGHVLTNSHVVAQADKVTITLVDGKKHEGRVVGKDPLTDVAVVRFVERPDGLVLARLGRSADLRVGQWVLAVGSPLGLAQTVTAGIVSGLESGRGLPGVGSGWVRRYIQTDAAINPGNSGGPLVNLAGEVLGINTFINVGPGGAYGYAIAMDQVGQVAQTLIKEGRVRYPYLGVQVADPEDLPPELRPGQRDLPGEGAFVVQVVPGGPAAAAGLQEGDVITGLDGKKVTGAADVVDAVSSKAIGAKIALTYRRQGDERTASATLAELPTQGGGPGERGFGLSLQTLTPQLSRSLGLGAEVKGAVIAEVRAGSPAERAGLEPGEVIIGIDRRPVTSADDAVRLLRAAPGKAHLLQVKSARATRFVTLPPASD